MIKKKNVLLIKSPFQGIGKLMGSLFRNQTRHFNFLELKYSGNRQLPRWDSPPQREEYNPDDFSLVRNPSRNRAVTSMRFSDVLGYLDQDDYFFRNGEDNEVELVVNRNDYPGRFPNQSSIEKIAGLVVDRVDAILPIWSRETGGYGFLDAMGGREEFFNKLKEDCKPGLYNESRSIQEILPEDVLMSIR